MLSIYQVFFVVKSVGYPKIAVLASGFRMVSTARMRRPTVALLEISSFIRGRLWSENFGRCFFSTSTTGLFFVG